MIKVSLEEFKESALKGNRIIPVYKEYLADFDTPVSVLNRFREDEHVFLLESVEGGERFARHSFIGINPFAVFCVRDGVPVLKENDGTERLLPHEEGKPFFALRDVLNEYRCAAVPGLPNFFGGAVGYIGYSTINEFEPCLPKPKTPPKYPTSHFILTGDLIIFDNMTHTLKIVCCARIDKYPDAESAYNDSLKRIAEVEAKLKTPSFPSAKASGKPAQLPLSNMSRDEFTEMVKKAKEYITNGDVIQIVLSQRFRTELNVEPIQLYRALRLINPSPYMFFIKLGKDKHIVGASPEIMVRLDAAHRANLRPIAGTRPRGKDEQQDRALADELLNDVKERAEHLMLVDLGRNDLGRLALPGTVQVSDFMTVERYSHVMHLVSNIEAQMPDECDGFDLLKASFPAGTLSGAPKIRAMEIIRELEKEEREVYGGSIAYFGFNGTMDSAITIRTLEVDGDTVSIQAGAGIVYDSDPLSEYQETLNKAKAMFKALELASAKLEL